MRLTPTSSETATLIRTDFTDGQVWQEMCDAAQAPSPDGFRAGLELVDDRRFEGFTVERAVAVSPDDEEPCFAFLADPVTITDPEHPVVVVDLHGETGRRFRVTPPSCTACRTT